MTIFPIAQVNELRNQAAEACPEPDEAPDGWSKSKTDPMKLLGVFKTLKIKPGFVLRAYQYRAGGNGNGVVWAMPVDVPFPKPADCPMVANRFLQPPKPPQALDELMDAIEGDGTPWSYLSASIFAREAAEFGAIWHGCHWSTHTILGAAPWQRDLTAKDRRKHQAVASGKADEWKWNEPRPTAWEPSLDQAGDNFSVSFLTISGLGQEMIYRWTDSFKAVSYAFDTKQEVVAEGPGGYVF